LLDFLNNLYFELSKETPMHLPHHHTNNFSFLRLGAGSLAALTLVGLLACGGDGGGGSATPPPPPAAPTLVGIWQGTMHPGTDVSRPGYLAILPDQSFRLMDSDGFAETTGNLTLTGSSVGGAGTWYQGRLGITPSVPVTFSGTFTQSPSPTLAFGFELATSGMDCEMVPDVQATSSTQALLAGSYTGTSTTTASGLKETIVIASGGLTFTGTARDDSGLRGSYTGTLAAIQNLNAFTMTGTYTPSGSSQPPIAFAGLAYVRAVNPNTLIIIADSAAAGGSTVVGGVYSGNSFVF
jgi:hypothetical protein